MMKKKNLLKRRKGSERQTGVRSMLLFAFVREGPLCSGQQQLVKRLTHNWSRIRLFGMLSPKWDICITPSKAQGTLRKRRRKECKSQRKG